MFRKRSTNNKQNGFGEMPSSSDLGKLLLCEVEYVHERRHGKSKPDALIAKRSEEGVVEHLNAQVAMETFHNRQRAATPASGVERGTHAESIRDNRCFVASVVYGANAPETEELRSYRDNVLSTSVMGRVAIRMYYCVSPPIAKWLSEHSVAARVARLALDRVRAAVRTGAQ